MGRGRTGRAMTFSSSRALLLRTLSKYSGSPMTYFKEALHADCPCLRTLDTSLILVHTTGHWRSHDCQFQLCRVVHYVIADVRVPYDDLRASPAGRFCLST